MTAQHWAHRVADAYSSRDPSRVAALFAANGMRIEYASPGAVLTGREAIQQQVAAYLHAVPDAVLEVERVIDAGRERILQWRFAGTHTGDLPGLPASGSAVALAGVSICSMTGEDIEVEHNYFDGSPLRLK